MYAKSDAKLKHKRCEKLVYGQHKDNQICPEEKKIVIKSKNIGEPSIVPASANCLLPQAVDGGRTVIYYGSEVEPTIAVNPCDPSKIVISYQDSRINNGGGLELSIQYSHDFGKTWTKSVIPLQACIGGVFQRLSDPVLSYRADGKRLFFNILGFNVTELSNQPTQYSVAIVYSDDDGVTWSQPIFLSNSDFFTNTSDFSLPADDKNWMVTDPNDPCVAYVAWDRFKQAFSFHAVAFLSKTIDGGDTWFPGVEVYDATDDLCKAGLANCVCDPNPAIDARETNQVINTIPVVLPKFDRCSVKKNKCESLCEDYYKDASIAASCGDNKCLLKLKPNVTDCDHCPGKTNGDLLLFMARLYAPPGVTVEEYQNDFYPWPNTRTDIVVIRSSDQGRTWSEATLVAPLSMQLERIFTCGYEYDVSGNIIDGVGSPVRATSFIFYVTVDLRNGNLYVVYMSDQFRSDLQSQIALTASYDGGCTWTSPVKVSRTPQDAINPQAFTPGIVINDAGYIGITYYDFRFDNKSNCEQTKTDYWMAFYKDIVNECGDHELVFIDELRLTKQSFIMQSGPLTGIGYMSAGDYEGLATSCGYFYEVHTETLPGPFTEPVPLNPEETLFLDNNNRTDPFVSILKLC